MYPPVDPDFYSIGSASGMSDDEIQKDWEAYCDDLAKFHAEIDAALPPPIEPNKSINQIKQFFTEPKL